MKLQLSKRQQIASIVFLTMGTLVLSACGSTDALSGAGGLAEEVTATASVASAEPVVVIPTEEPTQPLAGHIIFTSDRDGVMNLYMTSPDGLELTRLTSSGSQETDPRISPDGTKVAFVSTVNNNMDIYVLDIASQSITRITDAPEKDSAPAWSADGTKLAFESFRDGNFEIYMVNVDGSNTTRLTNDPSGDNAPVWSPTTNDIVFVSNRFGNRDILLLTSNGSISSLTTNIAADSAPTWSPDGNMIAFQSYTDSLSNICVIGRDGLNQRCLTTAPSEYSAPVWSPNGTQIAASAKQQTTGFGVDIFNLTDNSVVHLYSIGVEPQPTGAPVWSLDGRYVVFQAQTNGDMELYLANVTTNEFVRITSTLAFDGEPIWTTQ